MNVRKFEILMNQLESLINWDGILLLLMPELSVLVHKISKIWEFHFVFSNILPIEIF